MEEEAVPRVSIDVTGEPWIGTFPGLGRVLVDAAGDVAVLLEPHDTQDDEMRDRALRFGWAEPLSLVRRGYLCLDGVGLVAPEGNCCLVVGGSPGRCSRVMLGLVERGWAVLGDRLIPAKWVADELLAFPREAPVLALRRHASGHERSFSEVRLDSDAVDVHVMRANRPTPVRALATITEGRGNGPGLLELSGREKFDAAAKLLLAGVMSSAPGDNSVGSAATVQAEHVRLASLPHARLTRGAIDSQALTDQLVEWWHSCSSVDDVGDK